MIRYALAAVALAATMPLALAASDEALREQIVGSWGQDEACASGALSFAADGTFTFAQPGRDPQKGTWSITDAILKGSMEGTESPPANVDITEAGLTIGEIDSGKTTTLLRCPS